MLSHFFERRAARAEKRRKNTLSQNRQCHIIPGFPEVRAKRERQRERSYQRVFLLQICISWQISPLALEGEGERSQRTSLVEIFNKKESLPRNITAE